MVDPQTVVAAYWDAAEARDWPTFATLLSDDVVYELPQTGERIVGRGRYVQFNQEYPGDWHVSIARVTGAGDHAASWTRFVVDGTTQHGLCFFDLDPASGLIARITDFWPAPYEPPPGREHLVERFTPEG